MCWVRWRRCTRARSHRWRRAGASACRSLRLATAFESYTVGKRSCAPQFNQLAGSGKTRAPEGLRSRRLPTRPIYGLDRLAVEFRRLELTTRDVAHDSGVRLRI